MFEIAEMTFKVKQDHAIELKRHYMYLLKERVSYLQMLVHMPPNGYEYPQLRTDGLSTAVSLSPVQNL